MRKFWFVPLLVLAAAMLTFGMAQEPVPDPGLDPRAWFTGVGVWAGAIVALVSLLKTHVFKAMTGLVTLAISFGVGVGGAVIASFVPWVGYEATFIEAVVFGASAAALASGGWDAVRKLIGSKP